MTAHPNDDVAHNILNEQRGGPIDRNPLIDCDRCGDGFAWMDYWKERVNQMENPRKEQWLCDDCKATEYRLERIRRYNQQLSVYRGQNGEPSSK